MQENLANDANDSVQKAANGSREGASWKTQMTSKASRRIRDATRFATRYFPGAHSDGHDAEREARTRSPETPRMTAITSDDEWAGLLLCSFFRPMRVADDSTEDDISVLDDCAAYSCCFTPVWSIDNF